MALADGPGTDADSVTTTESDRHSRAASTHTWVQAHHSTKGAVSLKQPRQLTPPIKSAMQVGPSVPPTKTRHKTPPRKPPRPSTPVTPSSRALADAKNKSWIQQKSTGSLRQTTSDAMLALLPHHKIHNFNGDYMKWPSFISAFKHLVHDVVSSDAQRFAILIGYLAFIQKLRVVVTVLKDNGFEHELRSGVILGNLLAKLPYWAQTKWSRYAFQEMEKHGSVLDVEDLAAW